MIIYWFSCLFVITPVYTAVVNFTSNICYSNEFLCGDGTCVELKYFCDGYIDCPDGSDELECNGLENTISEPDLTWKRAKRQATSCLKNQYQCRDGTCIESDRRCDGTLDCPDNSDETFALCRKNTCQSNLFRCAYGACVAGTAPCNGVQECADNSDELLAKCRNEVLEVGGQFRCRNGETISATDRCDGVTNCADGTDETLDSCAETECLPFLFKCAYGACVDANANCNDKQQCADGSDESDELCNRLGSPDTSVSSFSVCILPPYPKNGRYFLSTNPSARPGQKYISALLNITCNDGYMPDNRTYSIWCFGGEWSAVMPKCVRFCRLDLHQSVQYRCGSRECDFFEPAGTVVKPACREPDYYYRGILYNMRCRNDGQWNYVAFCEPDCGRATPASTPLILGGRPSERGELPWHAGIYFKEDNVFKLICGGSLISNTAVISAAHCFWSDSNWALLPSSLFGVAVGKLYRRWNSTRDKDAQLSNVEDIQITELYNSARSNYQDDIALVKVSTPFQYRPHIRPVCVNFDNFFEYRQLQPGSMGKVAGWGLITPNGTVTAMLKVVSMPVVSIPECRRVSPDNFLVHLTSDKFCAGYTNGTTLCQGDSGGGLTFAVEELGRLRYYLRGVVSVAPQSNEECNSESLVTFTKITNHEALIKNYL